MKEGAFSKCKPVSPCQTPLIMLFQHYIYTYGKIAQNMEAGARRSTHFAQACPDNPAKPVTLQYRNQAIIGRTAATKPDNEGNSLLIAQTHCI